MRLRRALQFGLLMTLFWLPSPSAQAHAELVASSPAVGSHIGVLPSQVSVTFDGNLLTIGGSKTNVLVVRDPQGTQIDAQNSRVSGATLTVDVNPATVTGEFSVSWRVVSGDGHPEEGSYRFTVGGLQSAISPAPSALATPSPAPAKSSVTAPNFWSRYGSRLLLLVAGVLAVGIWIRFERARRKLE